MSDIQILPMEVERAIVQRIHELFEENHLQESFPNRLIREDALDLLDRFCTVVYYPLEGEKNNGFHVNDIPFADGQRQNFVFINTAQTMEKQVFTAAHELGHLWGIDDYIIADQNLSDTSEMRELIINRFAAVLLIPEREFRAKILESLKELVEDSKAIPLISLLRFILVLMNHFFVPMKAIVLRLVEVDYLSSQVAKQLLDLQNDPNAGIELYMQRLIVEYGYVKFQKPSMKKWIEGLAENLDRVERLQLLPQQKIDYLRGKFDLKQPCTITPTIETTVSLDVQEGFDTDDA